MKLKRIALAMALSLCSLELAACATIEKPRVAKVKKKEASKDWSKANFSLSKNSDVDWKLLKRGRKSMGGPALDSY